MIAVAKTFVNFMTGHGGLVNRVRKTLCVRFLITCIEKAKSCTIKLSRYRRDVTIISVQTTISFSFVQILSFSSTEDIYVESFMSIILYLSNKSFRAEKLFKSISIESDDSSDNVNINIQKKIKRAKTA